LATYSWMDESIKLQQYYKSTTMTEQRHQHSIAHNVKRNKCQKNIQVIVKSKSPLGGVDLSSPKKHSTVKKKENDPPTMYTQS